MKIVRIILIIAAVFITVGYVGWRVKPVLSTRADTHEQVANTHVARGTLTVTLAANGVLESAVETPVRSEIAGNLVDIRENNTPVKAGDEVFRLDTKEYQDRYEEQERLLAEAVEALSTLQSDSEVRLAQVTGDVTLAEEAYALAEKKANAELDKINAQIDYAQSELARAESEYNRNKRLAEKNYIPGTKLREAEQAFKKKQFDLEYQRAQLRDAEARSAETLKDNQHSLNLSRLTLKSARANADQSLEDARIRIADAERKVRDAKTQIEQCTVTAPVAGLVVIGTNTDNWPERRPYRLGDQVSSRTAPVVIYDLQQMRVRCQIGEMDVERVRVGQEVLVTSATQREKRYRGTIAVVAELAREANVWQGGTPGKRVFNVLVDLGETDPNNLRPGMTVDMEIVLDSVADALLVPIRAVFTEGGRSVVYRLKGNNVEVVPVTPGKRNDLQIVVSGKLHEGDILALEPVRQIAKKDETKTLNSKETNAVVSALARKGDLLFSVNQTGVVVAKRSTPVVPEISGRVQWVTTDGVKVTSGSMLLQMETRQAKENLLNLEARREEVSRRLQRVSDVGDASVQQGRLEVTRAENNAEAFKRQNEVTLELALKQLEFREQELIERRENLDVKRRLAAKGLLAGSEVEREAVALQSAEFALQRETRNYELQKSQFATAAYNKDREVSDISRDISRNRMRTSRDMRMAKYELDNLQVQIDRARADLAKMTLTVPTSGLLMLSMQSTRGDARTVSIGDWANQGRDVATIVSLEQLQVKLELDQTQITGIKMAQVADIVIDALPGKSLKGKVSAIGQTARRPSVQGWTGVSAYATFPVTIDLPPDKNSPVRPGMRAGVNIVVRKIPNVLMAPNESIFRHQGRPILYVQRNGEYRGVAVELGESNGEFTIITRGVKTGERIALNDLGSSAARAKSTKGSGT